MFNDNNNIHPPRRSCNTSLFFYSLYILIGPFTSTRCLCTHTHISTMYYTYIGGPLTRRQQSIIMDSIVNAFCRATIKARSPPPRDEVSDDDNDKRSENCRLHSIAQREACQYTGCIR